MIFNDTRNIFFSHSKGWSLDNCVDEKSKATIEKMLLEEQYPFDIMVYTWCFKNIFACLYNKRCQKYALLKFK